MKATTTETGGCCHEKTVLIHPFGGADGSAAAAGLGAGGRLRPRYPGGPGDPGQTVIVILYRNDGMDTLPQHTVLTAVNGRVALPVVPPFTREGHILFGWAKSANSDTTVYKPGDTITGLSENLSLYAVWGVVGDVVYVNASGSPAEGGTVNGAGPYRKDEPVTLTATPNKGYHFVKWTEGSETVSTSATYSFTARRSRVRVVGGTMPAPRREREICRDFQACHCEERSDAAVRSP